MAQLQVFLIAACPTWLRASRGSAMGGSSHRRHCPTKRLPGAAGAIFSSPSKFHPRQTAGRAASDTAGRKGLLHPLRGHGRFVGGASTCRHGGWIRSSMAAASRRGSARPAGGRSFPSSSCSRQTYYVSGSAHCTPAAPVPIRGFAGWASPYWHWIT